MDIIVPSCNAYSDAWRPFVTLFHKFWPSCPWRLVLITDKIERAWHGDKAIVLDSDMGWSGNLECGLGEIHSEFVLLMQEDFFINAPVQQDIVHRMLLTIQRNPEIMCARLMPCPGADVPIDECMGIINHDADYRVSCQAAIWRKEHLVSICRKTNSPANFEIGGTKLSRSLPGYYVSIRRDYQPWPLPYLVSAISRGRWNPDAIALCKKYGIPIDLTRPVDESK